MKSVGKDGNLTRMKFRLFYRRMLDLPASQGVIEEDWNDLHATTLPQAREEAENVRKSLTFNGHYFLAMGIYDGDGQLLEQVEVG